MYSPILNRFTSRDPLPLEGEPDILYGDKWVNRNIVAKMNLYAYVENNPVNGIDPSGLIVFSDTDCANAKPKSDITGCIIHRGIVFLGLDAECVCRCAGSTGWDNFNRGCLECAEGAGVDPDEAHAACYKLADAKYGVLAGLVSRLDIGLRCQGCVVCGDQLYGEATPPYSY